MNHHFPASDIPKQARAFYIRNRIRVIPDVGYLPQPIRSASDDVRELDLSDSTSRSVSPVHIQYLKNMCVAASASVSIVKDGVLWGLVACHHQEPKEIPLNIRVAYLAVAGSLARQIRAKDEATSIASGFGCGHRKRSSCRSLAPTVSPGPRLVYLRKVPERYRCPGGLRYRQKARCDAAGGDVELIHTIPRSGCVCRASQWTPRSHHVDRNPDDPDGVQNRAPAGCRMGRQSP
jgi:hypothetical protein